MAVISIHSLRGEGDGWNKAIDRDVQVISIHSLRGEGDNTVPAQCRRSRYFNPLPPWGGRLGGNASRWQRQRISIHSLRGEGDVITSHLLNVGQNFNPLPPWGGRPLLSCNSSMHSDFNPLPPWGGRQSMLL